MMMNKREAVLSLLDKDATTPYVPAGFFLHFDPDCHFGRAAVEKHLDYFHYTGMDFVKIQYELALPAQPEIKTPSDWTKLPIYGSDLFEAQWQVAKGLVEAAGKEALVIMTLYSPYMCAGQVVGRELLDKHIRENPDQVKVGMERVTESLMTFVKGCIQVGIDGFYHSTQGSETNRFGGSPLFETCIKPYDLILMNEINQTSTFNILHICDYHGSYADLSPFLEYPGDVVNCSLELSGKTLSSKEVAHLFNRPFMGGMDRHGTIVSGSKPAIEATVDAVLQDAPGRFILGADCTLPGDIDWDHIKTAIAYAHDYAR
jgi:uroporphyrinogen decarboxylase